MKWQKVLLVSLPPLVISGGLALLVRLVSQQEPPTLTPEIRLAPSAGEIPPADHPVPAGTCVIETAPGEAPAEMADNGLVKSPETLTEKPQKDSSQYQREFRDRALSLSANPLWVTLANHPRNLWVLVKVTEQLAGGERPLALADLGLLTPFLPFEAVPAGDAWIMSPATEARMTPAVEALKSLEPEKMAELFKAIEPELERILHEELGYPQEDSFRTALYEAMEVLLKTPLCEESPRLVRLTSRLYRFESGDLEGLSPAQKFLLRMGRKNQAEIQGWLRAFWQAL